MTHNENDKHDQHVFYHGIVSVGKTLAVFLMNDDRVCITEYQNFHNWYRVPDKGNFRQQICQITSKHPMKTTFCNADRQTIDFVQEIQS